MLRGDGVKPVLRCDEQRVRGLEGRLASNQLDVVAPKLVLDDLHLPHDHVVHAREELRGGRLAARSLPRPPAWTAGPLDERQDRFTKRLAGIVPVSTQTPPMTRRRSITAARLPAGPLPIQTRSNIPDRLMI